MQPNEGVHLLLWNARGLYSKLNEFKNYLYEQKPLIVGITETHLNAKYNPRFPNYKIIRKDRDDGYGGLAILHHQSVAVKILHPTCPPGSQLENLCIQYQNGNTWSHLTLIYNPCKNIKQEEFDSLFSQCGQQGIVCGDYNAHHSSWESNSTEANATGRALFSSLASSANLMLLNRKGMPTRVDPSSGKGSNLDLIIATSDFHDKEVTLGQDLGSDHIPVLLSAKAGAPETCAFRPRWKLNDDNWMSWRQETTNQFAIKTGENSEEDLLALYRSFNEAVMEASTKIFGLTKSKKLMPPGQPWWNEKCREAVKNRRNALWKFYRNPSPANKTAYNKASQTAKQVTKEAKEEAWTEFLSRLKPSTPSTVVWRFFGAMNGKRYAMAIPFSNNEGNPVGEEEAADILAKHYLANFSYSMALNPTEEEEVAEALRENDADPLNQPITALELEAAIKKIPSKSSPGEDLFHNRFITHLPEGLLAA